MDWHTVFRRPAPAFAVASLLAVALGALVCALNGVPAGLWGRNVVAWSLGALAAAALSRWAGTRTLRALVLLTPLGLAAPMLSQGQEGVHRWLDLGPLHVNIAMLLLPAFVVALAGVAHRVAWWWVPAVLAMGALILQPDASQATALAIALGVAVIGLRRRSAGVRWAVALAALSLAGLSWTRPDPLAPVPEVEGVIGLAAALSPWLAAMTVLSLAAAAAAPALTAQARPAGAARWAGYALGALLLAWIAAPALGAFPVPFAGVGPSPIVGAWLGVGLLAALARTAVTQGPSTAVRDVDPQTAA